MLTIDMKATGQRMKEMCLAKGIKPKDIMDACGFSNLNGIYRWFRGETLPALDNFIILADLLDATIDSILVIRKVR